MKITKRQMLQIINEETQRHVELTNLNQGIREAYAEHLLLTYPNALLSEGLIDQQTYTRARKMQMLNESNGTNAELQEAFFDDVKAMASKVGSAAGRGIKKAGSAVFNKAKEIGNKEIDTKKFATDASRVGKEAGTMIGGAASGMWNALAPIAKKLGSGAATAAKSVVKSAEENLPSILKTAEKVVGKSAELAGKAVVGATKAGARGIGATASGIAGMIQAAREGLSLEKQATQNPQAFLSTYKALHDKLEKMGVPTAPKETEASLGIWQAPDGQAALAHGAKQAGVTPAELQSLTALYITQSKYVDMATKAQATMAESRDQLKARLSEIIKKEVSK